MTHQWGVTSDTSMGGVTSDTSMREVTSDMSMWGVTSDMKVRGVTSDNSMGGVISDTPCTCSRVVSPSEGAGRVVALSSGDIEVAVVGMCREVGPLTHQRGLWRRR